MSFDTYEINHSIVILLFRCGLNFSLLTFTILIMSGIQEITKLVSEAEGIMSGSDKYHGLIKSAMDEVANLLKGTQDSLSAICRDVEAAAGKEELKKAFKRLNGVWSIFLGLVLPAEYDQRLLRAISAFDSGARFASFLATASSASCALSDYKSAIMSQLANSIRMRNERKRVVDVMDESLFSRFLPEPSPPCDDANSGGVNAHSSDQGLSQKAGSIKRPISEVAQLQVNPLKKSRVPALASVAQVSAVEDLHNTPKKKVLMTREKLRSGLHDPRGLLNIAGSSTNALEHMKRLELLKSAGVEFDSKKNSSFSEKLNAAVARLDLGLGGQSLKDSLLFGAKILSLPRALSTKNISDIEYNSVYGNTTWSHQNMYAKMMISGCLNQSRRIFEKFDEVLFGAAPEAMIEECHQKIRNLLCSEEARRIQPNEDKTDNVSVKASDELIKSIIEAVTPIIPISVRNKSLDGGYLRTALYLLGAAEFLFTQYEPDIRVKANPAGLVGMCSTMHAEIERSVLWQQELRSFDEFMKDMRSQYQTSLGLGTSFANDAARRQKRRPRSSRGRPFSRGQGFQRRTDTFRSQQDATMVGNQYGYRGRGRGTQGSQGGLTRNLVDIAALRARGVCYDYSAGACARGDSCRYFHSEQ